MIVSAVGGRPVRTSLDWEARVLDARIGQPLVISAGATPPGASFTVVPRDLPSMTAERVRALSDFEFVTVTPSIQAERGLDNAEGALIVDLSENAHDIGLQEGDVVVQINRYPVRKADDAAMLLRRFAGRGPIRMVVERDGQLMSISFYVG
jgi:S1-C subfamily serine protease